MRHEEPHRSMGQEPEGAKARRKILKPLLEKRRRERMNRSLGRLRSLLLPAQEGAKRRVEKTEILEHTVHFLTGQNRGPPQGSQGPSQQHQEFQDGFSACLHRASHFLQSGDKAPWLAPRMRAALEPRSVSIRLKKFPHSVLRELTHRRALNVNAKTNSCDSQSDSPRAQAHCADAESGQRKNPSPGPQRLWRPWP